MSNLSDDDGGGGNWQSASSSAASSSFSSGRRCSDVDYYIRDCPLQSEVEEIPSFRWLMMTQRSQPVPTPPAPEPPSEVYWGHLVSAESTVLLNKVTDNHWVVLVEGGTVNERCALVLSPGLEIEWRDDKRSCWRYHDGAAVLEKACWLDIRAKVDAADLCPQTACISVLVFQLLPTAFGLGLGGETQEVWVAVGDRLVSERTVSLQPGQGSELAGGPRRRKDGWLEIELGEFSAVTCAGEGAAMVEMGLREVERLSQAKGGLVVRGVEVRPKHLPAAGEGEGPVWVSTPCSRWALPELYAEPFPVGDSWMLSCWLARRSVIKFPDLGPTRLKPFPNKILQRSYSDWIPRVPIPPPEPSMVKEIPFFRWLVTPRSPAVPKPPAPEGDRGHLVSARYALEQVTGDNWVIIVEGRTVKERCAVVLAPGLEMRWRDDERSCWLYLDGAAILAGGGLLDIRAKLDVTRDCPRTTCVSVLVFQLLPEAFGLGRQGETQEAWVAVCGRLVSERTVRLQPARRGKVAGIGRPRRRSDGWLEIELGEFPARKFAGKGKIMVEMGLSGVGMMGLVTGLKVRGMEVRPMHRAAVGAGEGTLRVGGSYFQSAIDSPFFKWSRHRFAVERLRVGEYWTLSYLVPPSDDSGAGEIPGSGSPIRIYRSLTGLDL